MSDQFNEALQAVRDIERHPFQIGQPLWFNPEHTEKDINCYVAIAFSKQMFRGWIAHIVRAEDPLAEFEVPVDWLVAECPYKLIFLKSGVTTTGISLVAFRGGLHE